MSTTPMTPVIPAGRRPTPRPAYATPHVIRHAEAAHHVWGDRLSGYVTDRVYSSTQILHVLEYELPPGGEFRHSETNRTIFGADVGYFVVSGAMVIADPSTGEMRQVEQGEGVLMRPGTWHNAFNPFSQTVRVVEYFCPPPALGAASDFAQSQPPLAQTHYQDARWRGQWPAAQDEERAVARLAVLRPADSPLQFRDHQASHLQWVLVSTEFLQVISGMVMPGHVEEFAKVAAEGVLVVTEGELWVDVWSADGGYTATTMLTPGDAMYLPHDACERLLVRSGSPARYLWGQGTVPQGWTIDDVAL